MLQQLQQWGGVALRHLHVRPLHVLVHHLAAQPLLQPGDGGRHAVLHVLLGHAVLGRNVLQLGLAVGAVLAVQVVASDQEGAVLGGQVAQQLLRRSIEIGLGLGFEVR